MRSDRELLQDALEVISPKDHSSESLIAQILDRLAEPDVGPVAWIAKGSADDDYQLYWVSEDARTDGYAFIEPLYRHPPRPVRLSDVEIRDVFLSSGFTIKDGRTDLKPYVFNAARAIEKAILEKNK